MLKFSNADQCVTYAAIRIGRPNVENDLTGLHGFAQGDSLYPLAPRCLAKRASNRESGQERDLSDTSLNTHATLCLFH
jgi:hypothetical protein